MRAVLLAMVVIISLLGACASPSATPEQTPTPPIPTSTPEPNSAPTPQELPELPHYKIALVRFEGFLEGSSYVGEELVLFQGEVRNDSPVTLEDMEVIITIYDKNDNPLTTDRKRIIRWVLPSGETSTFALKMNSAVNAAVARISFELPERAIIELSADPGVQTELWWARH